MKYGFIGCGNMGGALARAAAKAVGGENLWLADADPLKAESLSEELGAKVVSAEEIAKKCDYIVLGVKPQNLGDLLQSLPLSEKAVLVSMAAGVTLQRLASLAKGNPLIRMMPNTPVGVGAGRILYSAWAEKEQIEGFLKLFEKAGALMELEEKLIDAGTAVSGCGPAFVCLFIEALADGGVACGLPREQAMELAAGVVMGTGKMVLESGLHPAELKDAVCSPGGSTIEGVHALEAGAFRSAAAEAVIKSYQKTMELGK